MVTKERLKGSVKWFNESKGFGFITREGGDKDVFLHANELSKSGLSSYIPAEGDELTFEIDMAPRGPKAVKIETAA